ncbi:MAG: hypothetical protein NT020_13825 [Chloroflexales bacterium]|nr:hypothetical protein [Chloroflexales bacterium]
MSLYRSMWQQQRFLMIVTLLHVGLIPVVALLFFLNPVVITGVDGWVKPLKFAISGAIYAASIAWIATLLPTTSRWYKLASGTIAVALVIETALITLQVVRATTSHYNISTPLNTTIYSLMATFISMLATANIICLFVVISQKTIPALIRSACGWGLTIAFVGMIAGVLMTSVNVSPSQLHTMQVDKRAPANYGAHSVGVDDGGPGLPLLGWSTVAGDLRVGHFVGLHGLQLLPLLALLLLSGRLFGRQSSTQHQQFLHLVGVAYTALTGLLIWQAFRGQSLIKPDVISMSSAAAIVGVSVVSAFIIFRDPPHMQST